MYLYRWLGAVFFVLALVGCVEVTTGPGRAPYAPYSPENMHDRGGDGGGGGGDMSGQGRSSLALTAGWEPGTERLDNRQATPCSRCCAWLRSSHPLRCAPWPG